MKLEKDLVREILLQVEAWPDPRAWVSFNIPSHSKTELAEHIRLLDDAGFLDADDVTDTSGYDWQARRLTYEGHEFLDTVRDNEIWRLTKETAKKTGTASVQALFEIGKSYAKQKLIEHGVHL